MNMKLYAFQMSMLNTWGIMEEYSPIIWEPNSQKVESDVLNSPRIYINNTKSIFLLPV